VFRSTREDVVKYEFMNILLDSVESSGIFFDLRSIYSTNTKRSRTDELRSSDDEMTQSPKGWHRKSEQTV
jgi:hypothetical protein